MLKRMLLVLIIILGIFIPTKVFALEDSFYEGEFIPNIYIRKENDEINKTYQIKIFKRKSDDRFVYSIQLDKDLSKDKILLGYDNYQNKYIDIDYPTWERISLISYYGYGYLNHTDIKWYAITQFMMWQVLYPDSSIYFIDDLNGNKISLYEDEIKEINELITKHNIKPSFNMKEFSINYKEKFVVTDSNNVLDKFAVSSSDKLSITKKNNDLTIKSFYVKPSTLILINQTKQYNNNPTIYIDDNGMDLLLPGNYNPVYSKVDFNVLSSNVIINMFDKEKNNIDNKFIGSTFQILDIENKLVQEKVIGDDGKLVFQNIGYGNYYLKQIKSSDGYLLNNEIINLNVDEDIENINFYNETIKNKIRFQIYDKTYMTGIKDVKFSIYKNREKIITFNTDTNGYYELELPYGTYLVKQELGNKDYNLLDDFEITVLKNDNIQTFELYSDQVTANIKLINTDLGSNLPILEDGATFEIKNLDKEEAIILKTNEFGITDFIELSSGNYEVKQITAVDGYYISNNLSSFKINSDMDDHLEIIIPNIRQKSKLKIERYIENYLNDKLINRVIDNSVNIAIYAKEDIYLKDGTKIYLKDQEINNINLLEFGNYYIKDPTNDSIIDIILKDTQEVIIELVEKVYEYKNETNIDLPIINNNVVEDVDYIEEVIIDVPNTYLKQSFNFNILFILLGLILYKGKLI